MSMRRIVSFCLVLVLCLSVICPTALAATPRFSFELSVDGGDTKYVRAGDIVTVVLALRRTDTDSPYTMFAMQDEIRYDSDFFQMVEGSAMLYSGVVSTDVQLQGQQRELYLNYLSAGGGASWSGKTIVGMFQLRVIGTNGVSKLTNQDYLVSLKGGNGSYSCVGKDVTVILSKDCTVRFEENGGSAVADQTVLLGEKVKEPAEPTRSGCAFGGWYSDPELTKPWSFSGNTVECNMTLYAKWIPQGQESSSFTDVRPGTYYYDAVRWAVESGITTGTSATTFSPDMVCTRAQAVTFLWRQAGCPKPEGEGMAFRDVSKNSYYYDAVCWAVEQGITTGTSATTFSPNMNCSRAHIMTFLWRAQGCPASAEKTVVFKDVPQDAYYASAVLWAAENGITTGTSASAFSPDNSCTRAQIVTFLWRMAR